MRDGEMGWAEYGHEIKSAREHFDCLEENSCHAYGHALRLSPRKASPGTSMAGRLLAGDCLTSRSMETQKVPLPVSSHSATNKSHNQHYFVRDLPQLL